MDHLRFRRIRLGRDRARISASMWSRRDCRNPLPPPLKPWAYRWLYHKYFVDEFYDATVVDPTIVRFSAIFTSGAVVDAGVIDGAVNGVGKEAQEHRRDPEGTSSLDSFAVTRPGWWWELSS